MGEFSAYCTMTKADNPREQSEQARWVQTELRIKHLRAKINAPQPRPAQTFARKNTTAPRATEAISQSSSSARCPPKPPTVTKVTPEIKAMLENYLNDDCTYTLERMRTMLRFDMNVDVSTSAISRHLGGMLYTVKQVRVVPMTCNSDTNKALRQTFAKKLKEHQKAGDFIVYFDETNFNVYCKRGRGRAKKGDRATVVLPPSKGPNLQMQCAVNSAMGLVVHRLERGSIRMEQNAAFIDEIYCAAKGSATYRDHFLGKKVVVVLDNAPAHRQTEARMEEHDDLVLLRLGTYSPMCNPIEGCFSVLKAKIKDRLALDREELCDRSDMTDDDGNRLTICERKMRFLERAATASMSCMTSALVACMELHCRDAVNKAAKGKYMVFGK
jgi:transposase